MIINNNETPDVSRLGLEKTPLDKTRTASAGASKSTGSTPGDDSISLSNSGNLVQQSLASASSARLARVQQLKALVQSNQYNPDAVEVSRALISAHIKGE